MATARLRGLAWPPARWTRAASALTLSACGLAGCQSGPPALYDWGPYQAQLYTQLQGTDDGPQAQIEVLERHLARADSQGRSVPPGYLAQLGYLQLMAGHHDQAAHYWTREKAAFPESATFMDFLLNNLRKTEQQERRP